MAEATISCFIPQEAVKRKSALPIPINTKTKWSLEKQFSMLCSENRVLTVSHDVNLRTQEQKEADEDQVKKSLDETCQRRKNELKRKRESQWETFRKRQVEQDDLKDSIISWLSCVFVCTDATKLMSSYCHVRISNSFIALTHPQASAPVVHALSCLTTIWAYNYSQAMLYSKTCP